MTFKKLLTMAAAIMMAGSMWAQGWTPSAVAEGDYYLYNVGAKGFVVGANNWGTRVSIADKGGIKVTLAETSGAYEIKTSPTYNGKHLGFNGYVDNGDANQNWIFEAVEGETNVYKLSTGSAYLFADAGATTTTVGADPGTNYAYWILVSVTDYVKDLAAATDENPMDATCLFLNPNFSRDASQSAWTMDAGNKNLSGGTNENRCAESFQSAFTLTQTVEVPNGYYKVRAQAALTDYTGAYDGADYPVVYANDATVPFFSMDEADRGTNMGTLSNSFAAGKYTTEWIEVTVTNKSLTIGVKGTRTNTWCIWDNFQILYAGPLDLSDYEKGLADAVAAAKAVDQAAPMQATVLDDLKAAIAAYESVVYDNSDDYEAAVDAVNNAISAAEASIAIYEQIAVWNALADANLNTTGKETYAAILNAYNNRTATESNSAKETYHAQVKAANIVENADLTSLIVNPSFETGNHNGWSIEGSNDTGAKDNSNGTYTMSKVDGKYVFNTWSVGNPISQTITDMPTGVYTLTAVMGTDGGKTLEITGNGTTGSFASVDKGTGVDVSVDFNCIDGNINISAGTLDKSWYKVDNFKLYFVKAINLNDLYDEIDNLVADAKAITSTSTGITNELTAVIAKGEAASHTETDFDKLGNVIDELKAAISKANAYAGVDGYLEKMKGVLDNTNVYTAAAYDTWYANVPTKYAAGEYTNSEAAELTVNGAYSNGWHSANKIDDILLSAWTVGGEQAKDYSKGLYINTWSVEADGKANGSGVHVPFFEYWTGDANSLGANTLEATMTDLPAGTYEVEALVRVRIKNDNTNTPYGITLSANSGETVDVCAGKTCDDGAQFRYDTFTVIGTVGEDGILKIDFNVAADNNISWLSYKDVKYTKLTEATLAVSAAAGYATFVAPFDVEIPDGVKASKATGVDAESNLVLEAVEGTIPANTPVILESASDVSVKVYGKAVDGTPKAGLLTGVYENTAAPAGSYVLQNQTDGVKFYLVGATVPTVKAGHAYLTIEGAGVKAIGFGGATAIKNLTPALSEGEGVIYNLAGQRVNTLQKGINIVGGKKVLVK